MLRDSVFPACLVLLLAFTVSPSPAAELTEAQTKSARESLAKLQDNDFQVREQASQKLVDLGPAVIPMLNETLAGKPDPETEARCRQAIKTIMTKHLVDDQGRDLGLNGSRVTIDFKGIEVQTALRVIAQQSGNAGPTVEKGKSTRIDLSLKDVPYWQAVDEICKRAKLMESQDYSESGGCRLTTGDSSRVPTAYTGPLVVHLVRIVKVHELQGAQGPETQLILDTAVHCEDRVPLVSIKPTLQKALGSNGELIYEAGKAKEDVRLRMRLWSMMSGKPTQFTIPGFPVGQDRIGRLEGTVQMTYGVGRKSFKVEDLLNPEQKLPRTSAAEDITLTVASASWDNEWRDERLSIEMTLSIPSIYQNILQQSDPDSVYGLFLTDPDGKRYIGSSHRSSWQGDDDTTTVEQTCMFAAPRKEGNWSLVFLVPEQFQSRSYPFEFQDVELP